VDYVVYSLAALSAFSLAAHVIFFMLVGSKTMRTRVRPDAPVDPTLALGDRPRPPVTIMKPCAGADDDLDACLESFCRLNYPSYQIVFGVRDASDAAYPVLQTVKARHPEMDIEIVLCSAGRAASPKVANLEVMITHAKHATLWLSDSNTLVHPDTLASMIDELNVEGVGVVASPIVGVGETTLGSTLEILQLSTFTNLTAMATIVFPGRLTVPGKSMLVPREIVEAIGFDELGKYFGEDEILFSEVRKRNLRCVLGRYAVGNVCRRATVKRFMSRHHRWAQIRWSTAPMLACLYEFIFSPVVPSFVWAIVAPTRLSLTALAIAMVYQLLADSLVLYLMRGRALPLRQLPVIWLRPMLSAYLSFRAAIDRRVEWRGQHFWMGPKSSVMQEPPLRAWLREVRGVR